MPIKNSDIMQSMEDIYNAVNPKLYTQEELDKAVKAERRELLRLITEVIVLPPVPKKMLIEAISARNNK